MTARRPLPPSLVGRPFHVREATAAGVPVGRLRARDLERPTRSARMPRGADLHGRCIGTLCALPASAFVCGITAAELHGLPVPWRQRFEASGLIELGTPGPGRAVRRAGIRSRSLRLTPGDVVVRGGLRVTSPVRTWCDLAARLTVPELVAVGDVLLRRVGLDALDRALARHPDHRVRAKLRVALELLDQASESPKESELRALVVLAGLPKPLVNVPIFDPAGRFVARVDQLFDGFGEVLEYQGDHHRTDWKQWRRDRTRESELESLGFHVTEITQDDLSSPRAAVGRIAANLRRRGWTGTVAYSPWFPR